MARAWLVRVAVGVSLASTLVAASTVEPPTAGATRAPAVPTLFVKKASPYALSHGYVGLTFEATTLNQPYLDPTRSDLPFFLDQLGQGKENARAFLRDNPDLADDIEKRIKDKLGIGAQLDAPADEPSVARLDGPAPIDE